MGAEKILSKVEAARELTARLRQSAERPKGWLRMVDEHLPEWMRYALRRLGLLLLEAGRSFSDREGLRQASGLAFYTALALLPTLLLLTYILSMALNSREAMQKTSEVVGNLLPRFSEVVLREVNTLVRHRTAGGLLNLVVLAWSLTPLVASLRSILGDLFGRPKPRRSLWRAKATDLGAGLLMVLGLSVVAGMGLLVNAVRRLDLDLLPPATLRVVLPFVVTVLLVYALLLAFTPKVKHRHLLAGALCTTLLWFLLRPAFTLFLTMRSSYGVAFGSFKSIFVIFIWIYYSQAALVFGAELAAVLHRRNALHLQRLMEGSEDAANLPGADRRRLVMALPAEGVFFREGDTGREAYHLVRGSVSIRKGDCEIGTVEAGEIFGELSLLLHAPRTATAVAREDCECLVIREDELGVLMHEHPDTALRLLRETAQRLREADARGAGCQPQGA